jgi:hypothetical protein
VRCHASCFKNWEIAQPLQAQPVRDPSGPEIRRANKFEHKIQLLCTHDIYSRKKPSSKGEKKKLQSVAWFEFELSQEAKSEQTYSKQSISDMIS